MASTIWADAVARIGRRCRPGGSGEADADLLRRFADTRDELAFRALVERHGPLVWGVAARHAADPHAAEDAFQATFFALARLAGRLHGRASLAGWLHTVAVRTARRTRSRLVPLPDAAEPIASTVDPLDALSARELLAALDQEVGRLPERYRQPLVLCCLEGLSRDEAAARLGWSAGAVKGRLERGRELLRKRLAARGVGLPAALAALTVTPAAVPGALRGATAEAAVRYAATGGSGGAAALAGEVVRAAVWGHWRAVVLAVGAAAALTGGVGVGVNAAAPPTPVAAAKEPTKPAATPTEADPDGLPVRVRADGKPVAGAKVWTYSAYYQPGEKSPPESPPLVAGASGTVRLPARLRAERSPVCVFARGPAGRVGCVVYNPYQPPGPEVVVDLAKPTELAGRITDPAGAPLPGIEVELVTFARPLGKRQEDNDLQAQLQFPPWEAARNRTRTRADGRFALAGMPAGYLAVLQARGAGRGNIRAVAYTDEPLTLTLPKAGAIRIRFTGDGAAKDTKGMGWRASIEAIRPPGTRRNRATGGYEPPRGGPPVRFAFALGQFDGSGAFVAPNLTPGTYTLACYGGGSIPVLPKVPGQVVVKPGETADVTVHLTKLARVTGRVIDAETGKPLAKVPVMFNPQPQPADYPIYAVLVKTDAGGRYTAHLPAGYTFVPYVNPPPPGYLAPEFERGRLPVPDVKLTTAGHAFPDIKLRKSVSFNATVVDAGGKPVAATVYTALIHYNPSPTTATAQADGRFTVPALDPRDLIAPRAKHGNAVNVPAAVEVGGASKPVRITVAEANACRVAGRVTDARGRPVHKATVSVSWHYWGVGKSSAIGTSRVVETLSADADGRYRSAALWPTDHYNVTVTAPGYGKAESAQVLGVAGQTHELPDVRLVRTNLTVRGVVVDRADNPVADATVFNRGDGERELETASDADGTFTLKGFRDGPAFVFARKEGYRLSVAPAEPGEGPVRLVLRKATDPPVALPPARDDRKVTRHLLGALWAVRARLDGFERNVFDDMARFDPAAAREWAGEAKGGFPARLKKAEQQRKLLGVAKADPEEALARLAGRKGRGGYDAVYELARELLPTDKAKAGRVAEEAVVRARALNMPERAEALAAAGFLAARCGNVAGGKAVVAEAATLAEPLPADGRSRYYRGRVATYVAPFDLPRAEKMLAAHTERNNYNHYLALALDRVAVFDPKAAAPLLDKFRADNSFAHCEGRLYLAYRLAATDPDAAAKLVAGVDKVAYRTLGYARLARLVARADRPRAWKLIDRALAGFDTEPSSFETWSNYGGTTAIAARVAAAARDVGHPDSAAGVVLALSRRPTNQRASSPQYRERELVQASLALALVDPVAARRVLAGIAPPEEFARRAATTDDRNWLFAVALVLPDRAPAVIDQRIKRFLARKNGQTGVSSSGLIGLSSILTAENRYETLAGYASLPRVSDDWRE
jgi:RNA polymerase sigma factor (sigma-70 family)